MLASQQALCCMRRPGRRLNFFTTETRRLIVARLPLHVVG
jgi:hypothetical protein